MSTAAAHRAHDHKHAPSGTEIHWAVEVASYPFSQTHSLRFLNFGSALQMDTQTLG